MKNEVEEFSNFRHREFIEYHHKRHIIANNMEGKKEKQESSIESCDTLLF